MSILTDWLLGCVYIIQTRFPSLPLCFYACMVLELEQAKQYNILYVFLLAVEHIFSLLVLVEACSVLAIENVLHFFLLVLMDLMEACSLLAISEASSSAIVIVFLKLALLAGRDPFSFLPLQPTNTY